MWARSAEAEKLRAQRQPDHGGAGEAAGAGGAGAGQGGDPGADAAADATQHHRAGGAAQRDAHPRQGLEVPAGGPERGPRLSAGASRVFTGPVVGVYHRVRVNFETRGGIELRVLGWRSRGAACAWVCRLSFARGAW